MLKPGMEISDWGIGQPALIDGSSSTLINQLVASPIATELESPAACRKRRTVGYLDGQLSVGRGRVISVGDHAAPLRLERIDICEEQPTRPPPGC